MTRETSSAFELLDRRIQRWIWGQAWEELRDIQEQAIRAILGGTLDVVIASATASGKTEAAFLPIASAIAEAGTEQLSVLAVSPLKALINDQHERLESFFEAIAVPVHPWHGDIAASRKRKVLIDPRGILLITPESLEALFVRHGSRLPHLFQGLRYVVVDELHAFIGTERGRQLQSLLHRVELLARRRIPRVALSATLGDMELACEFLRPGEAAAVHRIVSTAIPQELRLQIRGYRVTAPKLSDAQAAQVEREGQAVTPEEVMTGDALEISRDLFRTLRGGRHIVFANRRADVEMFTDLLRRLSESNRVPNEFWPHHGSLDKTLRGEAEDMLKADGRPATVIATSTLELGIDVGTVESIAQIDPPPTVAAMRQRLGRSGRRGDPAVLRIYVREPELHPKMEPQEQLRAGLVQSVAMVELLAERWYEPPVGGSLHLSTLIQQVLSLIAQHGGARADQTWKALCLSGAFRSVDAAMFARLLRDLAAKQLISQTHDGELVLDLEGERLVNHYKFYAAFQTPMEYRLVTGTRTLGTVPITYPLLEGMYLIFGGRRWRVLAVDGERRVVELEPAAGGKAPQFGGMGARVHDRVRERMKTVYVSSHRPGYLNRVAQELLDEGRSAFRRYGLADTNLLPIGHDTLVFPWAGDRVLNTLAVWLIARGLQVSLEGVALLIRSTSLDTLRSHLCEMAEAAISVEELADMVENKVIEKHHPLLGAVLLSADYASAWLDMEAAGRTIRQLLVSDSPEGGVALEH